MKKKVGIRGVPLKLLVDYPKNSKQLVKLNIRKSTTHSVVTRVPQGTIFVVYNYINVSLFGFG